MIYVVASVLITLIIAMTIIICDKLSYDHKIKMEKLNIMKSHPELFKKELSKE